MMKYVLLFLSILSPIQVALASTKLEDLKQRPLTSAINAGIQNQTISPEEMKYLLDKGVRSFDLSAFANPKSGPWQDPVLSTKLFRVNPKGSINEGALVRNIGTGTGQKLEISIKDPQSGEIIKMEQDFKYNPEGSPERIYEEYKKQVTQRPNAREMIHRLPMESTVFFYGLGLSSILSLITESENDPRVFARFLEGFKDPVFYASFVTFIIGNRVGSYAMNSLLLSSVFSKTMSMKARMRLSQVLIPQLGMAAGGLLSNGMHDLVTLTKGCADHILRQKPLEERKKVCGEAAKQVFSNENAWRYGVSTLSMVSTGFLLAYGPEAIKNVGRYLGRNMTIRSVGITLFKVASFIPTPQTRLAITIKNMTYGAIHLMVFLKMDEWLFHPFYHHVIEKHQKIGPKFLAYQKEMQRRLSLTGIDAYPLYDKASQAEIDRMSRESIANSGVKNLLGPKPTPTNVALNVIGTKYNVRVGVPETLRPLTNEQMTLNMLNNNPILPFFLLPDFKDNSDRALAFSDLLQKHYEISDLWRQSIQGKVQRQFQSWLETIAPFNAISQMTYEFYYDFYKEASTINEFNKPVDQLVDRHILLHDDILANILPRDLNGKQLSDTVLKNDRNEKTSKGFLLTQRDIEKINTIRQSVCWLDSIIAYNAQNIKRIDSSKNPMERGRNVYHKIFQESFLKIRSAFAQHPEDLKCNGYDGTLSRERTAEIDMTKIHAGLLELSTVVRRYSQHLDIFNAVSATAETAKAKNSDTISASGFESDEVNYTFKSLNLMEQLLRYLGGATPYERGERFIAEWDKRFKETQPEYYKLLNEYSPAGKLLLLMACPNTSDFSASRRPSAPPIRDGGFAPKKLIEHNKIMGTLVFNPPPVVNNTRSTACQSAFGNMLNSDFGFYNLTPNPKLGGVYDFILADTKKEIFGEATTDMKNFVNYLASLASVKALQDTPVESFFVKFKTDINGSPNRFEQWWNINIENQIEAKFNEITVNYNRGLQENLASIIKNYSGNINLNAIPDSLTESYLGQMSLYMDYILTLYSSQQKDAVQVQLARKLKQEILDSVKKELEDAINLSVDKDRLTYNHADTLALLKKFKSLIQTPAFASESPLVRGDSKESIEFRDALTYYREKLRLGGNNFTEWINDLELRVKSDEYMNEAFRTSIEEVGKNYESLKPVFLSNDFYGNGVQPIKELFNFLTSLSASVYSLTKITRLTTSSNYLEMDKNGVERRGKGSRKGF